MDIVLPTAWMRVCFVVALRSRPTARRGTIRTMRNHGVSMDEERGDDDEREKQTRVQR